MSNPFWSDAALEPKRKFRWLVYLAGMPQYIAKSVTKPAFNVGSSEHNFLQHKFNFPGRLTWQDITLTIVDPITPDATVSLYNIIRNAGYEIPTDVNAVDGSGHRTISKANMVSALGGEISIAQIGIEGSADNEIIEKWTLRNPQITSVTFDTLDYGSDELLNITIGIKYDWALLNEGVTGPLPFTGAEYDRT